MRPVARSRGDQAVVLRGATGSARVRPWPNDPAVAQLVLFGRGGPPAAADLRRWTGELARMGYQAVRTGALNTQQARVAETCGFTSAQELVLLEHQLEAVPPAPPQPTRRLTVDEHERAAAIDAAAFAVPWALDGVGIADVSAATARHRARSAGAGGQCDAYAISGRDDKVGFLQRLAVHPDARRRGLARALVVDSLRWSARWRAHRVLVNTHVGNVAALALYEHLGFRSLPERLRVVEKDLR